MAVRDEVLALPPEQRAAHKANRLSAIIAGLSQAQRSYTRNGKRWTVHSIAVENGMLRIVASCTQAGATLIAQDDPLNPMYFINPPVMVRTGTTPNPAYDASKPHLAPPTLPVFTEDLVEAVKQMLDAKLPR